LSPPSNRALLESGCSLAVDETCLSVKLHLGHVAWFRDRDVDAVLAPRYVSMNRAERECVKLWALPDIVGNAVPDLKLMTYSVDAAGLTHAPSTQTGELYRLARRLGATPLRAARAVVLARRAERTHVRTRQREQSARLAKRTDAPRILIVGHAYNVFDDLVGEPIIRTLEQQGCELLYSDDLAHREARRLSKRLSPRLYWTNNQQLLGAVERYRGEVDGIVFLVTFPCGPDSLVTELAVRKVREVPVVTLILDEHSGEGGLRTRLESFVDIIRMQRAAAERAAAPAEPTQPGKAVA